ncbi:DUF2291 family protein [Fuscibacter oryzae]|uniref:DUF2291 family protein n=1 Tax=Fuscibacter oryzae TaxID=2803939 RepID=A0A8J7SVZ2_9RHOB|nr:DUF2291 family protein [Fuscibacter oryzae]MBL4928344.1 DUF2291 family protein [Fuscibacter oryzae]
MKRMTLTAACLAAAFGIAGCKIVKTAPADDKSPSADASGDDARIATILSDTYDAKLLPEIAAKALPPIDLKAKLAAGLDTAGGQRGAGDGAAWNFAVAGQGKVVAANLTSRARTLDVDVDGDAKSDLTVQLGPVVKGSALRDFAPALYDFTSFRDQIEFAKLGRALNDRAAGAIKLAEGDPTGKMVTFMGVIALRKATDAWLLTPTVVEVAP